MDLSEEEINEMEERLFLIQKLKRRFGRSIAEILAKKEELEQKTERILRRQEYLDEIDAKIAKAFAAFEKLAKQLSQQRHKGSEKLDAAIAVHLKDLMLPNARFHTDIQESTPNENGIDRVEFLISMNPGEGFKPLSKTASGGELSRLMLGLKAVFTELEGIETVIFDEIDSGVSGPVAGAIGRKMQELSEHVQVFSVTHLAPVAAGADHHYFVSKTQEEGRTHTHVNELAEPQVLEQLAVIASGEITPASLAAAGELYERSRKQ
jgi:DNA repair protein RecN (Recombination protein N)